MTEKLLFTNKLGRWLVPILLGGLLLLGYWLVGDYGVSWDEAMSHNNGMVTLKFLLTKFAPDLLTHPGKLATLIETENLATYNDRDYGVAFELPVTMLEYALNLTDTRDIYLLRHMCTFFVCWLGIVALYQLGRRRFQDWRWGLLGVVLLVCSPRLFGEFFYNDKDAVFMALCVIATNTTVRFVQRPSWGRALVHALACAVAIDVRIMAVIWPLATTALLGLRWARDEYGSRRPAGPLLLYGAGLVVLVVAMWPYLWDAPRQNFLTAFGNMASFRWDGPILYRGIIVSAGGLPWHYVPTWVGITTPLPHVALILLGIWTIGRQALRRGWQLFATDTEWQDLLFTGLGLLPVVAVIVLRSRLYDGWRQLYFIYPSLLLVALRGAAQLVTWWRTTPRRWVPGVALALLAVGLCEAALKLVTMHPFQYVYFSPLAGTNVRQKYETDYWGVSYYPGLQWLVQQDKRPIIRVAAPQPMDWPMVFNINYLPQPDRVRVWMVKDPAEADYFLANYRFHPEDFPFQNEIYRLASGSPHHFTIFQLKPIPENTGQ